MRALCWHGSGDVRVQDVPEHELINDRDAIVRVTSTAIFRDKEDDCVKVVWTP